MLIIFDIIALIKNFINLCNRNVVPLHSYNLCKMCIDNRMI